MEGAIRILKRFVLATAAISVMLLAFNMMLLGVWFGGMSAGHSPAAVVRSVAEGLRKTASDDPSGAFALDPAAAGLLDRHDAWAMLIDGTGRVAWSRRLPGELPRRYTLTDVSKFTRSFLMDYPVFVWEHADGLVVVGYPKGSLGKYQHVVPTDWVSAFPPKIVAFFAANAMLALLLSLFAGSRLVRSIRPIIRGIRSLAEDRPVHVEPKGLLADLAENVNRVSALLQQKSDSLKSRDEARSNWIAGISHDIRTPLSMILGHASDLEENGSLPPEQRRQAAIIRQQAEKLGALVNDLNLVSMLEYEMQPLDKKAIRLSALARQLASEFLNNGLDERFSIELDELDETARVEGDERLLSRAVFNLIQNSIRHNPAGCRIRLRTSVDGDGTVCRFTVEDDGKGVDRRELADLVELPYSSKRKRPREHGHGLGLPMAARIARAHRGTLLLSGDAGKGFRAEFVLPALKS